MHPFDVAARAADEVATTADAARTDATQTDQASREVGELAARLETLVHDFVLAE